MAISATSALMNHDQPEGAKGRILANAGGMSIPGTPQVI
jgi:hypothetical protein